MAWGKEWDLGKEDKTSYYKTDGKIFTSITENEFKKTQAWDNLKEKVYNNKMPTHDPYTNPNSHIYYQCNCGKILDPGTKSFAALNNAASDQGWKVRWGAESYVPYCVECGKYIE